MLSNTQITLVCDIRERYFQYLISRKYDDLHEQHLVLRQIQRHQNV